MRTEIIRAASPQAALEYAGLDWSIHLSASVVPLGSMRDDGTSLYAVQLVLRTS